MAGAFFFFFFFFATPASHVIVKPERHHPTALLPATAAFEFQVLHLSSPFETMEAESTENLFRAAKRRKFQRRRVGDGREDSPSKQEKSNDNDTVTADAASGEVEADDAAPTTDVIRFRRSFKPRRGGIEFSTAARPSNPTQSAVAAATSSEDADHLNTQTMSSRFKAHSGPEVDMDKHMYYPALLRYDDDCPRSH